MPVIQLPADWSFEDAVSEDGQFELPADAVTFNDGETPDGYLHKSTVTGELIPQRIKRAKRDARKSLASDDSFWQEMAESRGLELREDGMPKGSTTDEELRTLRQTKAQHEALQQGHEALQTELEQLRSKSLEAEILRAAGQVKDGLRDAFVREVSSGFEFDADENGFVTSGEIQYVVEADGSRPKSPADAVKELQESQPDWFKSRQMSGSGFNPADSAGGKRTYTRAEAEQIAQKAAQGDKSAREQLQDVNQAMSDGRIQ